MRTHLTPHTSHLTPHVPCGAVQQAMCAANHWPVLRLDGTVSGVKRTKLVDTFNDPASNSFAFLLSSKVRQPVAVTVTVTAQTCC